MCQEQPLFILGIYWVEPPLPVIESLILKPELRTFLGDSLTFHHILGWPRRVGCYKFPRYLGKSSCFKVYIYLFLRFPPLTLQQKNGLDTTIRPKKKRRTPAEQANGTVSIKKARCRLLVGFVPMVPSSAAHVPPNYPCLELVSRVSGRQEPPGPWKAFPRPAALGQTRGRVPPRGKQGKVHCLRGRQDTPPDPGRKNPSWAASNQWQYQPPMSRPAALLTWRIVWLSLVYRYQVIHSNVFLQ